MRRFSLPGVLQRCPRDDDPRDDDVEPADERVRHDERDDEREDELAPAAALSPRVMTVGRASTAVRRWVLWTGLGVVLLLLVFLALRGPGEASSSSAVPVISWPDDEAKSFAASFAREFLAYAPARVDEQQEILGRMLASGVSVADVVSLESRAGAQRVVDVSVVRSKNVGGGHGRVTVAATVVADGVKRRVGWAIPVALDAWGGLIVDDFPAPAPLPRRGTAGPQDEVQLDEGVADPIMALLKRFMRAYLTGEPVPPEFLSPGAAATLAPLEQPYDFKDVISVAQFGPTTTEGRIVLATVRLVDITTKAQFLTRYRVQVAKTGDRWLVKKIQT